MEEKKSKISFLTSGEQEIALELGISNRVSLAAIAELIRRGKFKYQIEGKIYVPETIMPCAVFLVPERRPLRIEALNGVEKERGQGVAIVHAASPA